MGAEVDNPYDIVGVNRHMAADNLKKRQAVDAYHLCFYFFLEFND